MSDETRPAVVAELIWNRDLVFSGRAGDVRLPLDSEGRAGPSPMQALALALAGCMAIDVVDILRKGRHAVQGLRVALTSVRAPEPPRRFVRLALHFSVTGRVDDHRVARALALSRERYCSVWHSLRQDIELEMTHEIVSPSS